MQYVTLSNGVKMPQLGYGVYQVSKKECKKSVYELLRKLKTDYIDLMLLHQPFADYYGAWRALEDLYAEGKLKAIGISNFYRAEWWIYAVFRALSPW